MNNSSPASPVSQRRLGFAFTVSLSLHLGIAIGLGQASPFVPNGALRQAVDLHVQLRSPARSGTAPMPIPASADPATSLHQPENPAMERITPARFIAEPDFDALRDIPINLSGKIHFRLHVSSVGTISAIEVLRHNPLPVELLAGLKTSLAQTRLHPAEHEGHAVDSTLDITVRFDPVTMP